MLPNLQRMDDSPQVPEAMGVIINVQKTVSMKAPFLPVYGVLRASKNGIRRMIESMILVICHGETHVPVTDHIFKEIVIFEDDIVFIDGDACFYFNLDAFEVCRLEPKPGIYYINVSTHMNQSEISKVVIS